MSFVGADSDQLDGLSWQLGRHAQELETIRGILGRQIYTAPWSGAAADRFRDRWSGTDAPAAAVTRVTDRSEFQAEFNRLSALARARSWKPGAVPVLFKKKCGFWPRGMRERGAAA